jgi:hypothetical protein
MALQFSKQFDNPDHNLRPWCWLNDDTQTHVWKSFLTEKYPQFREDMPQFTVKPGKIAFLPHRYYKIYTRDDSPARGKEMTRNEAVEAFADASFVTADNQHLNPHEKKS